MTRLEDAHRRLLLRWRDAMNLVGPGPIDVHFDDCRRGLQGLTFAGRWVDLGSGAGFPGLVLADHAPSLSVDLVDSRSKRCVFLERVVAEAEAGDRVRVRCARVEELPDGQWDGVTARAFAPIDEVLAHAHRLVRPGGAALVFLQLDQEPSQTGWQAVQEVRYALNDGRPRRSVLFRRA
jgi:16S rRNA (guanine527-N7)-methyltransferase